VLPSVVLNLENFYWRPNVMLGGRPETADNQEEGPLSRHCPGLPRPAASHRRRATIRE
jgi:hypothetical protein